LTKDVWLGGQQPSKADADAFSQWKGGVPSPAGYPHTFAWYELVARFSPELRKNWSAGAAEGKAKPAAAPKKEKKKEEKKEEKKVVEKKPANDDDFDPFADDEEEDVEAEKAKQARFKELAKTAKSYGKAKATAKSLIVWEVKPWGEETDLDEMAKLILAINMDGLYWKTEYKKEPIAYGVFKIVIGATIEDDKVSTDEVAEKIEALEDHVQSVDV